VPLVFSFPVESCVGLLVEAGDEGAVEGDGGDGGEREKDGSEHGLVEEEFAGSEEAEVDHGAP
jgi:hypothetical protein